MVQPRSRLHKIPYLELFSSLFTFSYDPSKNSCCIGTPHIVNTKGCFMMATHTFWFFKQLKQSLMLAMAACEVALSRSTF